MADSGMYTSIGFAQPDSEIEVRAVRYLGRDNVHIDLDRLSVLLGVATTRRLRDALNALDLDDSPGAT